LQLMLMLLLLLFFFFFSSDVQRDHLIALNLSEVRSVRITKTKSAVPFLQIMDNSGYTHPSLYFLSGGAQDCVETLQKHIPLQSVQGDRSFFVVRTRSQLEASMMAQGFDVPADPAPSLSTEQSSSIKNAQKNPLELFAAVPRFMRSLGGFLEGSSGKYDTNIPQSAVQKMQEQKAIERQKQMEKSQAEENPVTELVLASGFEFMARAEDPGKSILKEGPQSHREGPLTAEEWFSHIEPTGAVKNVESLRRRIFHGGVEHCVRREVWKYLLGLHRWEDTYEEKEAYWKEKRIEYERMKSSWQSFSEKQKARFGAFLDVEFRIVKDVDRTDRNHEAFAETDCDNLVKIHDILVTYAMYNFDLGYVQGMSDLLSPILYVAEDECEAFWLFATWMDRIEPNFTELQPGCKEMMRQIAVVLSAMDPTLFEHLISKESSNMFFCFRWVLIYFKREFDFNEIPLLWEVMWCNYPCANYPVIIASTILHMHRQALMSDELDFDHTLKYINSLAGNLNLIEILEASEKVVHRLRLLKEGQVIRILEGTVEEINLDEQ
jgi:hypothetical protein